MGHCCVALFFVRNELNSFWYSLFHEGKVGVGEVGKGGGGGRGGGDQC